MSTTSTITEYTYVFGGNSVTSADLGLQFILSTGSILPTGFGDTAAINLASNLQNDLHTAGFSDAVVTVTKNSQSTVQYTQSGSTFV